MSAIDSQISQIYRGTPIGVALTRSLNAMIVSQQISGATAIKIMENFDESMPAMMKEHGVKRTVDDVSAEGELVQYNNLHELWKIDAENVTIKTGSKNFKIKRARFVFD